MAAAETLTGKLDELVANFNTRTLDLPDGLIDRKTQFRLNGAPFETLLGQPPDDPLVLMLARGPAGYRFLVKALQHAVPDARVDRGDVVAPDDPLNAAAKVWLSGHLRGSGEGLETIVEVTLRLAPAGWVAMANATVEPAALDLIRAARVLP